MRRLDWRDVPLPAGYPESAGERERILDAKPRHWRQWYDGTLVSNYEAPRDWVPATLTADQVREVNARNAVECELIDDALGRVLDRISARGWDDDTDLVFTTDHGELQGDFGLLFKGPYHVDALMRLPLIWRPAPSAGVEPAVVSAPVGLVDLAPTFCAVAGLDAPEWMQGSALPVHDDDAATRGFERVITEWDSELFGVGVHLRTITRDGWVCTAYGPGFVHDGTEGELYRLEDDPLQRENLWDDPAHRSARDDLVADLRDPLAPTREPQLALEAPV
jgi:arylsulfatase A-like enzyme